MNPESSLIPPPLPKRPSADTRPAEDDTVAISSSSSFSSLPNNTISFADNTTLPPPIPPRSNTSNTSLPDQNSLHTNDAHNLKPLLPPRRSEQSTTTATAPNMKTEVMLDNPGSLPVASANHRTSSPEQLPRATSQASVPSDASSSVQYDKESSPAVMSETSTSSPTAQRKMTNEEVAFQFDRHVQEIRRRRTRAKGPPRPDPEDFTTVEAESGKRILNVPHYIQAYIVYFVESLARDDRATRKPEPLQWSRIRALLSRLFDSSSPAQSFGLYVERVMYWENPPETTVWLMIYSFLWYNHLWLPGFLACFVFKMLNNRFRIIGNLHTVLNIPQSLNERIVEQQQQHRRTKMRSQLHQLIASRDLTDWLMTVMKIWGPYLQALAEENIGYIERFKNLMRWERPHQTWRVIALLMFYIFITTFFSFLVLPAIGFSIGVEFFFLLPLQKKYPRFSHIFSPLEWILWGVPTDTELAVERLIKQQEEQLLQQQQAADDGSSEHRDTGRNSLDSTDLNAMSPASRIKYEYQNRSSPAQNASSSTSIHSVASDVASLSSVQEKNEYHCMLRGKPGKLIIHEENIQFRSAKLLGRDIEAVIPWDMIDTIKKTKTMSIGLWSTAGIEVTDINGRQTTFQNVVHRDDAFRKLVLASGKRWASVK